MWLTLLLISIFCHSTLINGQQSPKPPPPQITNFLNHDLINPEQVKFNRPNALILPCGAIGSNLKWIWKHNETLIPDGILQFGNMRLSDDGTLTGSNLGITNSGTYQCFVKDTATNVQTFSRKIKVAVTVVGDFTDKATRNLDVTLGTSHDFSCPAHEPSYGISYTWIGKDQIQFKRNEWRAIAPNGDLFLMFVTQDDVNEINGLGGISCTISAANTYYSSGALTLTTTGTPDPRRLFAPTWSRYPAINEKAVEGRNKTFYCLALGRPAPSITWKKNGVALQHGRDSMEIPQAFQGRQLIIVNVRRDFHEDQYSCEAENAQGSAAPKTTTLTVEVAPKWTSGSPPNRQETIDIYGNGTLSCDVFAIPEPTFAWYRDGRPVTQTTWVIPDGNLLKFRSVRLNEAGIYQCVAENTHGMIVSSTYVNVLALPPSFERRGFGPFYLFEESEGRLKCDPDAAPRPNLYKWFKDGTELTMSPPYRLESDGTLVISNVERSRDAGQYKCSATNFLNTAEATAQATVLDRTRIIVAPQDQQVVEGTQIDLRCEATADDSLELGYYWKRDSALIVYNSKFQWLASQNVLTIIGITVDDAGIYTCVAYTPEPKKSEAMASAIIDIAGAPYPPTGLQLSSDCLNRSTTLSWVTGASNNATITHFLIERKSAHPNDVWRLIANVTNSNTTSVALNLTGWSELVFRVRAVNRFGPSRASLPTTSPCRTQQGVPDKWPDNFRGVPGRAEQLDIVWTPMPMVEWNAPGLYYKLWYSRVTEEFGAIENERFNDPTLGNFSVPDAGYYVEYKFKIQAGNNVGLGPESNIVRSFSGQDPPTRRPEGVTLGAIAARSVQLSWNPVTVDRGSVDGYRIYFWGRSRGLTARRRRRDIPNNAAFAIVTGGATQTYTVTNLTPYTDYNMAITAFNSGGEGPASIEVFAPTAEAAPGPPSNVIVYAFAKYVLVTWEVPAEPNGVITGYQVGSNTYPGSEPGDVVVNKEEVENNVFRKLLGNQEPEKNYVVELQARTSVGWGDTVTRTTRTVAWSAPAKPNMPTVEGIAVDKVRVDYNFGLGGGYTHEFLVMYRKKLEGEDFQNTSWVNHFDTQSIEIGNLSPDLYQFKTVARNDYPNQENPQESPASDVTEGRPLPGVVNAGQRTSTPIHKSAWFIALLVLIAILLVVLLIFVLYTRYQGAKYLVGKRERKRATLMDHDPYDEEEGAFSNAGRTENPPPYQSEGSLQRGPDSDRDSLDDYGEGPQFNEDGSFIEEYGDEKKGAPDEKDPSALATFV